MLFTFLKWAFILWVLFVIALIIYLFYRKKQFIQQEEIKITKQQEMASSRNNAITVAKNDFEKAVLNIPQHKIELSKNRTKHLLIKDMPIITTKTLTKSSNKEKVCDYTVIDIETTGLKVSTAKILQVSAIRFENFEPVDCFTTYINPKKEIPEESIKINGITNENVCNAPEIEYVITSLKEYIGKSILVGHNIYFDLKFLYKYGLDVFSTKNPIYDTVELSKKAFKDLLNYKLETVCKYNGIYFNAHNSLNDCLATGKLFKAIVDEIIY